MVPTQRRGSNLGSVTTSGAGRWLGKCKRPSKDGRSARQRAGNGLFSAGGCPPSIVSAAVFHYRVRDGNGWDHRALITSTDAAKE